MARLEAQKKMGYYPTPEETLEYIREKIRLSNDAVILDPCCGDGHAVFSVSFGYGNRYNEDVDEDIEAVKYGVELDTERAVRAGRTLDKALTGSIYDVVVRPLECFSMLYLNPPYDFEKGERMELLFLKHASKWLMPGGLLVYIVPENILCISKVRNLIARKYGKITIYRFARRDYPDFKQVVLFGVKLKEDTEKGVFPEGDYQHIEDTTGDVVFHVPTTEKPTVFELKGITPHEILAYKDTAVKNIADMINLSCTVEHRALSPIFKLRKGHMVSQLMSGVLNGELNSSGKNMVFKCYTDRSRSEREEEGKRITTDTYISGIRVVERGKWYDVR
jgi:16S rRNA G966 N2-methylase RsmD